MDGSGRLLPAAGLAKLPVGPKLPLDPPKLDLKLLAVLVPSLVDCSHQPTEPTIGQSQRLGEPGRVDVAWESLLWFGRRVVRGCEHRLCLARFRYRPVALLAPCRPVPPSQVPIEGRVC